MLFTPGLERTSVERIRVGQTSFDWLDKTAKPEAVAGRDTLERWFVDYPEASKHEFRRRFQAADNEGHEAAIFELYLYALSRALGFEATVNPLAPGGSRPEFMLTADARAVAYVEAKAEFGLSRIKKKQAATDTLIQQSTPLITVPGFAVMITHHVVGHANPSPRHFASFLNRWFSEQDRATARKMVASEDYIESLYEDPKTGWKIWLRLWPLDRDEASFKSVAGNTGFYSGWVDASGRLQQIIRDKCRQHRLADLPVVVAVASNDMFTEPDFDEVVSALVGPTHSVISADYKTETLMGRLPEGIWNRPGGVPVSYPVGVIHVQRCFAWALDRVQPILYDNPWVGAGSLLRPWPLPRVSFDGPNFTPVEHDGKPARAILAI